MSGLAGMVGRSWVGVADHAGHIITAIEEWPARIVASVVTCGRVRCTCGAEWDVNGWPIVDDRRTHERIAENTALCTAAGATTRVDVWGHWLTDTAAEVTCPVCLEWRHA